MSQKWGGDLLVLRDEEGDRAGGGEGDSSSDNRRGVSQNRGGDLLVLRDEEGDRAMEGDSSSENRRGLSPKWGGDLIDPLS